MDRLELIAAIATYTLLAFFAGWFASRLIHNMTRGSASDPGPMRELSNQLDAANHRLELAQQEAADREQAYIDQIAELDQNYADLLEQYRELQG